MELAPRSYPATCCCNSNIRDVAVVFRSGSLSTPAQLESPQLVPCFYSFSVHASSWAGDIFVMGTLPEAYCRSCYYGILDTFHLLAVFTLV